MAFGLVIVGTELLSGKRQDGHFAHALEVLTERGLELAWVYYVGDNPERLVRTLEHTMTSGDIVFSFGGIGATPDDHTRACAARAAGVELLRHAEAVSEIEARFGDEAYPHRVLMADLPDGSDIIPNPYNRIPGFSLNGHHFLPGFPHMAWPMMEWVLDQQYSHLFNASPPEERLITAFGAHESRLLTTMERFTAEFPHVQFSSLPHFHGDTPQVELGLRGEPEAVAAAVAWWEAELQRLELRWEKVKR